MKRILRYLKGTLRLGIGYKKREGIERIVAYTYSTMQETWMTKETPLDMCL